MSEAMKEALYLRSLLCEIGLDDMSVVKLYIDNRGAQELASNSMYHSRTKHIDIRHHFVRESVERGLVTLEHVSTDQMVADILTKALSKTPHWKCVNDLGLVTLEDCQNVYLEGAC